MRRHRSVRKAESSSSDDDDEDAFSAFSSRTKKDTPKQRTNSVSSESMAMVSTTTTTTTTAKRTINNASKAAMMESVKGSKIVVPPKKTVRQRHHGASSTRQAKMDALLQDLEKEKNNPKPPPPTQDPTDGYYSRGEGFRLERDHYGRPPPDKRGSFVEEGEEHLTTNIFVGNLAPSVTEEALTDLFRQFGDLYSVKIMWPRTAEERARNRNTGFVCFMVREDAQEAMDAYNDAEVFGRRMVLRWGKNVKKSVARGTGGIIVQKKRPMPSTSSSSYNETPTTSITTTSLSSGKNQNEATVDSKASPGDPRTHLCSHPISSSAKGTDAMAKSNISTTVVKTKATTKEATTAPFDANNAIKVVSPTDPFRRKFITTVASFVARDGSILEKKLSEREAFNPLFSFLRSTDSSGWEERVYYRWRVYAFAQGDGFESWRTEPFRMLHPNGRWWLPPPLDVEAARREEELRLQQEESIEQAKEERRRISTAPTSTQNFATGRQLEHAKFGKDDSIGGAAVLNQYEQDLFRDLVLKKLCASRSSIRDAMAFCFDKSGAATDIAIRLIDVVMDHRVCVETRVARLYLLSDVLFNSQQPGVKNAFHYRDAIEAAAPKIFASLGGHDLDDETETNFNEITPNDKSNSERYDGSNSGNGDDDVNRNRDTGDGSEGKGVDLLPTSRPQGSSRRTRRPMGRLTMNKLRVVVYGVLNAWTNWSVYNSVFIDELQARFEGKEVKPQKSADEEKGNSAEQERGGKQGVDDPTEQVDETDNEKTSPEEKGDLHMSIEEIPPKRAKVDFTPVDDNDIDGTDSTMEHKDNVDGEQMEDADIIDPNTTTTTIKQEDSKSESALSTIETTSITTMLSTTPTPTPVHVTPDREIDGESMGEDTIAGCEPWDSWDEEDQDVSTTENANDNNGKNEGENKEDENKDVANVRDHSGEGDVTSEANNVDTTESEMIGKLKSNKL